MLLLRAMKPTKQVLDVVSHLYLSAFWGARHTYVLMTFLGNLTASLLRVNLSVGLVAMVKEGKISKVRLARAVKG